jgi:hypothetical protein
MLSSFAQPGWKNKSFPLDKNALSALRFTLYDSGSTRLTIDNVYIEGFSSGSKVLSPPAPAGQNGALNGGILQTGGTLWFRRPSDATGNSPLHIECFSSDGHSVFSQTLRPGSEGKWVALDASRLSQGLYILRICPDNGAGLKPLPFILLGK